MTPSGACFRIVSANLWNGAGDPRAFAELVEALAPDAVATQELAPEQAEALARVLPWGQLNPTRGYDGMGIALREPAPVHRLALPYCDAQVAQIICQGAAGRFELEILNVHVRAPHAMQAWQPLLMRRGQLRGLMRHLSASPRRRRVLVGDLNATPIWPVYRRLTAHLTDAAVAAARRRGSTPRPTWGPWPRGPRILRIDHALVHGVAVDDFQVMRVPGTDHSAIVVDLAIPVAAIAAAESPPDTAAGTAL